MFYIESQKTWINVSLVSEIQHIDYYVDEDYYTVKMNNGNWYKLTKTEATAIINQMN